MKPVRNEIVPYAREQGALVLAKPGEILPVETADPDVAHGFLRLAAHILLESRQRDFRIVGIVSALPAEGKTTAALNLAICLGRTRGSSGRVLLVDGHLRSCDLTAGITRGEVTNGRATTQPTLRMTGYEGVDLLTAPTTGDRFSVDDPDAWARLLEALRPRYRLILVDCPSVLGSPEGTLFTRCVDGVVLVVRKNHTPRGAVEQALAVLESEPIGVIINGRPEGNGAIHR